MSKYIDAEKLKSILKIQIKERKEWMKDMDRTDRQDQLWSDLNGEDMSILHTITSLQQERPNTDEDDGKFVKILVRKEFAEQFQKLGAEIQAGQSSFVGAMNQQEQPEVADKEKSLSIQIQAYLNTASDELYAPGKPLYTKEHHKGIHECMRMWQKLHHYYFSTKQEQSEVDLEKEIQLYLEAKGCGYGGWIDGWTDNDLKKLARHFAEWGAIHLNARKEE